MLTIKKLEDMEPQTPFATGIEKDDPDGLYMIGSGKMLRWVAIRGGIADWAVYCHFSKAKATELDRVAEEINWIRRFGDKVPAQYVKDLVPCDEEAFARYRA